jgi:5-(carboxyamino)imidazole ribonucleotide mutase
MGSQSDWETMTHASQTLDRFKITHDVRVMSAHRTPEAVREFVGNAESRGTLVVIAAAGGAAHLAGVCAAHTVLPVLGVPIESKLLGLDSLLSTVQMPGGIPVGTFAIGKAGATNAALFAIAILGGTYPFLRDSLRAERETNAKAILAKSDPRKGGRVKGAARRAALPPASFRLHPLPLGSAIGPNHISL